METVGVFFEVGTEYLCTIVRTYSMEQGSSWETNWSSATQEIPRILWNSKAHYRIHKSPPSVPILSQIDPVHASILLLRDPY